MIAGVVTAASERVEHRVRYEEQISWDSRVRTRRSWRSLARREKSKLERRIASDSRSGKSAAELPIALSPLPTVTA